MKKIILITIATVIFGCSKNVSNPTVQKSYSINNVNEQRFGIEDISGSQDRYIDMQVFWFNSAIGDTIPVPKKKGVCENCGHQ